MPKLSDHKLAERRDHILSSAMRCFERNGIAATSVDEICAEGLISKGAFYTHFVSKDALIQELLQQRGEAIEFAAGTLAEFEATVVDNFLKPGWENLRGRVELEAMAASASDEKLGALMRANLQSILEQFANNIEGLEKKGVVRLKVPPARIAEILHCFLLGKLATHVFRPTPGIATSVADLRALLGSLFDVSEK